MSRNLYLKHYRLSGEGDVRPPPVAENGSSSTFRATDTRSDAPVLLTLIPAGAIPEDDREKFETNARNIVQFDHVHMARTVDFGQQDDEYAFVSEFPSGETTKAWVSEHGLMPPEAVLRIALQVVSAIGAAIFHQIVHAGIRPGNIIINPGQIAEGGWPSIKLVNLAAGGVGVTGSGSPDAMNFASPEQIKDGASDFRSEIYSLGATMCFLLTGVFNSAEPRSSQTRRFARPLGKLIQPMLRQDPNDRPQDLEVLAEKLRTCLESVERRQRIARRFGIPVLAVRSNPGRVKALKLRPRQILAPIGDSPAMVDGANEPEIEADIPVRRRWSPAFAIAAALLLGLGIIGAAVIPARHLFFAQSGRDKKGEIGVPIGVLQPASVWEGKPLVMNKERIAATSSTSPAAAATPAASVAPALAQGEPPEPASPAQGPQSVWEKAGDRPLSERIVSKDGITSASRAETPNDDKSNESARDSQGNASDRIASSADDRNRTDLQKPAGSSEKARPRVRPGSPVASDKVSRPMTGRGSVARIAADGSVILRLPNGEIAVLPPPKDEYPVRRYRRRQQRPDYPYDPRD
jgi:serine/threonine-protein kinase